MAGFSLIVSKGQDRSRVSVLERIEVSAIDLAPPGLDFEETLRYRNGTRVEAGTENKIQSITCLCFEVHSKVNVLCRLVPAVRRLGGQDLAQRTKALRPAYTATGPNSSSMRMSWLYFSTRSPRQGAPVLR